MVPKWGTVVTWFWRPISSRSIKFNCQCRTIRPIFRKHARLDWYVWRRFQQGIFITPIPLEGPPPPSCSIYEAIQAIILIFLFNVTPIRSRYTAYLHIVYDIIPEIIPDICHCDFIPDIWPDVIHDIWYQTDWFHPWIRKSPVLSQAVKKFLKHFLRNTYLIQE